MSKSNKAMIAALKEYGQALRDGGWEAGEPIRKKYSKTLIDFDDFAMALRLMFRADELLQQQKANRRPR